MKLFEADSKVDDTAATVLPKHSSLRRQSWVNVISSNEQRVINKIPGFIYE